MQFAFTFARILIALAAIGVAFILTKPLGSTGPLFVVWIGIPIAGVVLLARKRHVQHIYRTLLWCTAGMMVALAFCPGGRPPYEPGDEFRYMIGGAMIGWFCGLIVFANQIARSEQRRANRGG